MVAGSLRGAFERSHTEGAPGAVFAGVRAFLLSLGIGLATFGVRPAEACSPPTCTFAELYPRPGSQVPANTPGFVWRPTFDRSGFTSTVGNTLVVLRGDESLPYSVEPLDASWAQEAVFVRFGVALREGDRIDVTTTSTCVDGEPGVSQSTWFTVTPSAPLPTRAGSAEQSGPPRIECRRTSGTPACIEWTMGTATDVAWTRDPELEPWRDILLRQTRVDGELYFSRTFGPNFNLPIGTNWADFDGHILYRACAWGWGLFGGPAPGTRSVQFIAWVPGTTQPEVVTPQALVEVAPCPPDDRVPPDRNFDRDDDPNTAACRLMPVDAGISDSGTLDGGAPARVIAAEGCTCSGTRGRGSGAYFGLALALLLLARRGRCSVRAPTTVERADRTRRVNPWVAGS